MLEPLTCFACDRDPAQQCARCGRPYCEEHGAEFCDVCMAPASGMPSVSLYKGSIAALLAGTVIAVFLLVRPSDSSGSSALNSSLTPTSAAAAVNPTAVAGTPRPTTTGLAGTTTPGATGTGTPRPAGTAPAAGTGTPSAAGNTRTYTVQSGDTLSGICSTRPASMSLQECIDAVRSLNGISGDNLTLGETIRIPQ